MAIAAWAGLVLLSAVGNSIWHAEQAMSVRVVSCKLLSRESHGQHGTMTHAYTMYDAGLALLSFCRRVLHQGMHSLYAVASTASQAQMRGANLRHARLVERAIDAIVRRKHRMCLSGYRPGDVTTTKAQLTAPRTAPPQTSLMVTSTSTPGSMEMDVICFTTSAGECRSIRRLWILRSSQRRMFIS